MDSLNDQRAWARETLELSNTIAPDDTPVAILKRLAASDFVPTDDWHGAIETLVPHEFTDDGSVPLAYYFEREPLVRHKIEQFADSFFDLAPAKRRQQWEQLRRLSAPWPPLSLWLTHLQPGLEIQFPTVSQTTEEIRTFARFVGEQFRQRPGRKSAEYWEQLNTTFQDRKHWQGVAWKFQRQFPDQAHVFAPWVQEFTQYSATLSKLWRENIWATCKSALSFSRIRNIPELYLVWFAISILIGIMSAAMKRPGELAPKISRPNYQLVNDQQAWKSIHELLHPHVILDPPDIVAIRQLGKRAAPIELERLQAFEQQRLLGITPIPDEISQILSLGDRAGGFEKLALLGYWDQVYKTRPIVWDSSQVEMIPAWYCTEPVIVAAARPVIPWESLLSRFAISNLKYIPELNVHAILSRAIPERQLERLEQELSRLHHDPNEVK